MTARPISAPPAFNEASGPAQVLLIGIGAGDPGWLTIEAAEAIRALDVLFVVTKEREYDDLVQARRALLERYRDAPPRTVELPDPPRPWRTTPDYPAAVAAWRAARREAWSAAIHAEVDGGGVGGFLVWGDPGLYESTLAIVRSVIDGATRPITLRVLPGVSCVQALAARHAIPLNRQGRAVQIMPARLLQPGWPGGADDIVVMLDAHLTFTTLDPAGLDIYWGAYLGTPDEILISGPLADVADRIVAARADAAARLGWVFDTYLLRRRLDEGD